MLEELDSVFDWSTHSGGYGAATSVPDVIASTTRLHDPFEVLDALDGAVCHVSSDGLLNGGAPHFALLLMRAAAQTEHAAWPYLDTVLSLLEGYHAVRAHAGFQPRVMSTPFPLTRSGCDEFEADSAQASYYRMTVSTLRKCIDVIRVIADQRSGQDRSQAVNVEALLVRSAAEKELARDRINSFLLQTRSARALCGLVTAHWIVCGDADAIPDGIDAASPDAHPSFEADPGPLAPALLLALDLLKHRRRRATQTEQEVLEAGLTRTSSAYESGYGWHRELIAGDVLHALMRCDLAAEQERHFLEVSLGVAPDPAARASAATTAAWYLIDRGLRRHEGTTRILGPEDLVESERETLRQLGSLSRHWLLHGVGYLDNHGIPSLVECGSALTLGVEPLLRDEVRGVYRGYPRRASRWTWLRSPLDETPRGSKEQVQLLEGTAEAVTIGLSLVDHVDLARILCWRLELPFESVFRRLLMRWRESAPVSESVTALPNSAGVEASSSHSSIERTNMRRRKQRCRALELILAAAWGDRDEFGWDADPGSGLSAAAAEVVAARRASSV